MKKKMRFFDLYFCRIADAGNLYLFQSKCIYNKI